MSASWPPGAGPAIKRTTSHHLVSSFTLLLSSSTIIPWGLMFQIHADEIFTNISAFLKQKKNRIENYKDSLLSRCYVCDYCKIPRMIYLVKLLSFIIL